MEASYEVDSLNLLSASFGLLGSGIKGNDGNGYRSTSLLDVSLLYSYDTHNMGKTSWYFINRSIDYQRTSHTVEGRMLTLSYKINTRSQTSDARLVYAIASGSEGWDDYLRQLQRTDGSQSTAEQTFQVDYTSPFGTMHKLEAGTKYILCNNTSDNDRHICTAGTDSDYRFDPENSMHYRHRNDILTAYLGYGLNWQKLSGRLGVRFEHTIENVEYRLGGGGDFRKNYDDVVPSASLGWKPGELSNLRVEYNMRIFRPSITTLNPYLDDTDPSNLRRGNPELESEHSHAFDLSYSNFTPKLNVNLALHYTFTNSISSVTTLTPEDDIPGLDESKRMGKENQLNLSTYANWNATKDTRISANLYIIYTDVKGAQGMHNSGWGFFGYGGAQQSFRHDWCLSLSVFGQSRWVLLQGKSGGYLDYNLSLNKSFLERRLTLAAYASNFLKKYARYESHIGEPGFTSDTWSRIPQMRFGLSVSYRIGELKAGVKKAMRTISNDDVKSDGQTGSSASAAD